MNSTKEHDLVIIYSTKSPLSTLNVVLMSELWLAVTYYYVMLSTVLLCKIADVTVAVASARVGVFQLWQV